MSILRLFDNLKIPYTKKGSAYVMRCPFCKGDDKLKDHNAQINIERNGFYCFTEGKYYNYKEILSNLKDLGYDIKISIDDIDKDIAKRKREIAENAESLKSQPPPDFEVAEKKLLAQGYVKKATFKYYLANGVFAYAKHRYEKINEATQEAEDKTFLYQNPDGKATLKSDRTQRQIPYGLEQFFYTSPSQIWLTEGEKCRDILFEQAPTYAYEEIVFLSFIKSTDLKGYENLFENTDVVIFQDNDKTGEKNTQEIVEILKTHANTIKVVKFEEFEQGYDVADFLETHDWNDLIEKIANSEIVYKTPIKQLRLGVPDIDLNDDDFILEPYIPKQSVILFDGLGESGKTMLAMQLALSLAAGKTFLNFEIKENKKVLYLTAEENEKNFTKRLKLLVRGLNANNELLQQNFAWLSIYSNDFQCNTYRLLKNSNNEITPTEFYGYLVDIITHFKPSIVVLDSLINFYGLDENSSEQASVFMETLKMLTKEHDCSFVLLHHQTKEALKNNGEKVFRGSMVLREQARARITLQRVNVEVKKLMIEKLNYYSTLRRDACIKLATTSENGEPLLCFTECECEQPKKERQETYTGDKNGTKKATY